MSQKINEKKHNFKLLINWAYENRMLALVFTIGLCGIAAMLIFALMVVVNRYGDFVRLTHQHANILGPIGDFFGGILNPIFGFITIILVLRNTSLQQNALNFQKADLDHNQLIRDMDAMERLLQKEMANFNALLGSDFLKDRNEKMFSYRSAYSIKSDENSERLKIINETYNALNTKDSNSIIYPNGIYVGAIKKSGQKILKHLSKMIDMDTFEYTKKDLAIRLTDFKITMDDFRIDDEGIYDYDMLMKTMVLMPETMTPVSQLMDNNKK